MFFRDRREAGERLAQALAPYRSQDCVVLALPRGGVVVAAEIARSLGKPLDLVFVRKVGHPDNSEYAIGAVTDSGLVRLNEAEIGKLSPVWVQKEVERQIAEAKRRRERYLGGRPALDLKGKTALVVDDGVATGFTFGVALEEIRQRTPAGIVAALPVGPFTTVERLRTLTRDTVVLDAPRMFLGAIGAYYDSFCPVKDEDVVALMREFTASAQSATSPQSQASNG